MLSPVLLRIEGVDLPGRSCGGGHDDVHVGVQRKQEVIVAARLKAPASEWSTEAG
jgi:hypothetical protein